MLCVTAIPAKIIAFPALCHTRNIKYGCLIAYWKGLVLVSCEVEGLFCDVSAMVAELRGACKRIRKLGVMRKTVATRRLKKLRHLYALEKLATWTRSITDGQWIYGPLPPTPEQTTASMWAEVYAFKKVIFISGKKRSKQRVESFVNELEQGTASLTDEEFATLEPMIRKRRGLAAAHVIVAPIGTAQPCNPRSSPEISFDVRVYMEENNEGSMDPERGQLESPYAGTSFETPGQQCLPNWEMGRTCRRLLARWREFGFGGKQFFPHRTRYRDANR